MIQSVLSSCSRARHGLVVAVLALAVSGCGLFGGGDERQRGVPYQGYSPQGFIQAPQQGAGGIPGGLRCESINGGYNFCPGDTSGGVRLARQLAQAPCDLNRSWGFDSRGIWVDQGCAADFQLGSAQFQAPNTAPLPQAGPSAFRPQTPAQPQSLAQQQQQQVQRPAPPQDFRVRTPQAQAQPPQPQQPQAQTGAGFGRAAARAPSFRYGSAAKDEAVQLCNGYADRKVRSFGARQAFVDRVVRVRERDPETYEVWAYVRATYDEDFARDARRSGRGELRGVFYVKCLATQGRVVHFEYTDPV